jgi:hypothetical protein
MLRTKLSFTFLCIAFLINAHILRAQDVQGTWSGTMTMEHKSKTIAGTNEKKIKLVIQNNVVTGTVEGSSTTTVPGNEATVTCSGRGTGELWRVSLNADGTYDIEAISPTYTCTGVDATGKTATGEANPETLTVSSKPIGNNPNVLTGSHTNQGNTELGTGYTTTTWNLVRSSGVELIVVPLDYDNWLPVPGKDELTKGSVLPLTLKIQKIGGGASPLKAKKFELKHTGTSTEPGITINAPLKPLSVDDELPDIRIMPAATGKIEIGGQEMTIECNCLTATVNLAAFDGGGYTTLTVEALLEDNTTVKGQLLATGGETDILIPKRDPGTFIASSWLQANGKPGDTDDKEQLPNNSHPGDGLTAYEEYRGVISEGKFKRLDPQKMELGVWMKKTDQPLFSGGLSLFESATKVKVVRFLDNEINTDRKLNPNSKTAHDMIQFVEKLENGNLGGDVMGANQPIDVLVKLPEQSERVVIDVNGIKSAYRIQAQMARANGLQLPYTDQEDLANTVAHELAHGISVNHHGLPSKEGDSVVINSGGFTVYRIYASDGSTVNDRPYTIRGNIGTQGNDESGDLSCIMAYTSLYQWVKREVANGTIEYRALEPLPVGKTLCDTKTGDSSNLNYNNQYFGTATYGNCQSFIRLK